MATLRIKLHFHSINCPTLTQFHCKSWMLINRVTIYIFRILRHPGSMIRTQILLRVKPTTLICFKAGVSGLISCCTLRDSLTCLALLLFPLGPEFLRSSKRAKRSSSSVFSPSRRSLQVTPEGKHQPL